MQEKSDLAIVVCDDEKYVHEDIDKLIRKYYKQTNLLCDVVHFISPKELISADIQPDCLFLDLSMPDMDGIEAARELNKRGINYKIIILTCREERFKEVFEINAFRFVTKPIDEREFFKAIDDVRECLIGLEQVEVYRDYYLYNIKQKEILYIMASNSETIIYTADNDYRSEISLKQWNKRLDERMFFQCHRSYIVNLNYIKDVQKACAILQSGERVKVSTGNARELTKRYMEYNLHYK